ARDVHDAAAHARAGASPGMAGGEPLDPQARGQPGVLPRGPGLAGEVAGQRRCTMTLRNAASLALVFSLGVGGAIAQTPAATPSPAASAAPRPAWIAKSDANAQVLLDVIARFGPEFAGQIGINGLDEQV